MNMKLHRGAASAVAVLATFALAAGPASAAKLRSHGDFLRLNANQSSNWFGYNQGTLEKGNKLFNSISGDWTVPTATQHTAGQAESSSDWIGIGGGGVDSGCAGPGHPPLQAGRRPGV